MTIAGFWVAFLCSWRASLTEALAALPWLNVIVSFIAGQHLVPSLLLAAGLAAWFEGGSKELRAIRQRALLRAVVAGGLGWGLALLLGSQATLWLGREWDGMADAACWIGLPFPSLAASAGFALGAALWRADWRWGLSCLALVSLWVAARAARSTCYPLDVLAGALIGLIPGWIVGWAGWLERPLDAVVRFLRRMALA
jgi:hypothetical protein